MVDRSRLLLFAVVIWAVPLSLFAASARVDSGTEERLAEPQADERALAADAATGTVRQGCIASHLIRRVSFDDDRTGTLELAGRKRVRLTLRNACSGIRFNGYVHKPVNRRFCEGDILRVMGSGGFCVVDSLEPLADDALAEEEGSTGKSSAGKSSTEDGSIEESSIEKSPSENSSSGKSPTAGESPTGQR